MLSNMTAREKNIFISSKSKIILNICHSVKFWRTVHFRMLSHPNQHHSPQSYHNSSTPATPPHIIKPYLGDPLLLCLIKSKCPRILPLHLLNTLVPHTHPEGALLWFSEKVILVFLFWNFELVTMPNDNSYILVLL